jgi:flagellar protein FlaG
MIDRIAMSGIPNQKTTAINEGVRIKEIKKDGKSASSQQFEKKQTESLDQKKKEKIEEIVKGLNEFLKPSHASLQFKFHEKLNEYYVTLVDDITHEIIKEIPPKKLLDTYAAMVEHLGLIVDKKI